MGVGEGLDDGSRVGILVGQGEGAGVGRTEGGGVQLGACEEGA